jgi:circadian clock protein KaiB
MTDRTRKTNRLRPARNAPGSRAMAAVSKRDAEKTKRRLKKAALDQSAQSYLLRLYITGTTPASTRALQTVRSVCEEHLQGRYELEVFDIYQMPALAKNHQIIATPTLVKVLPSPLRRFIGDLSKVEKVLFGLDLRERG